MPFAKRNVHVVLHKDMKWAVMREGGSRSRSKHDTKEDAVSAGRDMARRDHVELVIHNRDGSIADSDSYGHDPRSSLDRVH